MPLHAYFQAVGYLGGYATLLWVAARLGGAWGAAAWLALGLLGAWMFLPGLGLAPWRGVRGGARVAFTFDDGPNPPHTAAILDVLRKHGAPATFFMVGQSAARYPEVVRRVVAEGHEVGNHTMTHQIVAWRSPRAIERELGATQSALAAAGARPRWFRAPHGFKSPFLAVALRRHGLRLVAWTRGCWDTDRPGVDAIVARTAPKLCDGQILLLHDGEDGCDRSQTAQALDRILDECARRGLRPVTLSEILASPAAVAE
jgi:peptidoglycan/xylan/chitin deacetylase (PgdA/CDA1 family)